MTLRKFNTGKFGKCICILYFYCLWKVVLSVFSLFPNFVLISSNFVPSWFSLCLHCLNFVITSSNLEFVLTLSQLHPHFVNFVPSLSSLCPNIVPTSSNFVPTSSSIYHFVPSLFSLCPVSQFHLNFFKFCTFFWPNFDFYTVKNCEIILHKIVCQEIHFFHSVLPIQQSSEFWNHRIRERVRIYSTGLFR